jgi:gliding motility-associated-like protein
VSITGGIAPYSITWSNNETTATINNLASGNYRVTVNDANGCSGTRTVSVNTVNTLSITSNVTHPACGINDGAIDITVSGASGNNTYIWSTGDSIEDLTGLDEGTYSVTVTSGFCTETYSVVLRSVPEINFSATPTHSTCGQNDGSIIITTIGTYTYLWSNGATTQNLDSIRSGFYSVTVSDANGCSTSKQFTISDNNGPVVTATIQNASCGNNNGFIKLSFGGPSLTFNWSHGPTTNDVLGLAPGDYIVTVTDNNGCQTIEHYFIIGSTEITVYADKYEPLCFNDTNGSIDVTPIGGSGSYTYQWSTTATTQNISGIGIGTYSISVTDANGCSATTDIIIVQPDTLIASIEVAQFIGGNGVSCNGASDGSLDLTVQGGTLPYTYDWSTGDSTQDISGLIAGTYSVTVADSNGCIAIATAVIIAPDSVQNNLTAATYDGGYNVSCNVNGGTLPYTYIWSTGATTNSIDSLDNGNYILTVTDANGCSVVSNYTIAGPICNLPPVAVRDIASITCETSVDIAVLDNDTDPDAGDNIFVSSIITTPAHGTTIINSDGTVNYTPAADFVGLDSFVYWEVIDITLYPNNEVQIFNRWGNLVYESAPYQNGWNGLNMSDEQLPDGTYFYILKLNDDNNTTYSGYVVINRGK